MGINRVNISGNLTRDPELRSTRGGSAVLAFGVAVNDRRRNAEGEWEDRPNFVDCVVFGNRAEPLSHYLFKGMKVAIEGKLRYNSWERDGQRRSKLEVVVDEVEFLSTRGQQQGGASQAQAPTQTYAQPQTQAYQQGAYPQQQTYQQGAPAQGFGQGQAAYAQPQTFNQAPQQTLYPQQDVQPVQGVQPVQPAQPAQGQPAQAAQGEVPRGDASGSGANAPLSADVYDEDIPF